MTHAERHSTSEPGACPTVRNTPLRRVFVVLALASSLGTGAALISTTAPATADQISDARAQAAAITAKIQATEGQIQALTAQVNTADYRLSQLQGQISATRAQMVKDQQTVATDTSQLQAEAISDYTSSGTNSTTTQLFTSNMNANSIRSEYSAIATGDVTTTIDRLHTAQAQLQSTQTSLEQQQTQATDTRDALTSSESQASALAAQDRQTLASVDANIQQLVAQQQAAAAAAARAAATAAFNQKVQAAQAAAAARAAQRSGGSTSDASGSGSGGGAPTVSDAPLPPLAPGAAGAVQAAEHEVGVPYVWGGDTPAGFDCSGLVQWAYAQVGISLPHYSGAQYDDTTHIPLADIEPGDLLFYGPGGSEHVAMYVGGGSMIEAPYTGASVWITGVRTGGGFAGVGRVG